MRKRGDGVCQKNREEKPSAKISQEKKILTKISIYCCTGFHSCPPCSAGEQFETVKSNIFGSSRLRISRFLNRLPRSERERKREFFGEKDTMLIPTTLSG